MKILQVAIYQKRQSWYRRMETAALKQNEWNVGRSLAGSLELGKWSNSREKVSLKVIVAMCIIGGSAFLHDSNDDCSKLGLLFKSIRS